ncbi:hypothetical protein BH23ACT5_BH23ACT5_10650 [soil metagenome]
MARSRLSQRLRRVWQGNRDGQRALIVGWFSYENSDFTAGDLLASDLVCEWLGMAGYSWDVAVVEPLTGGVDLSSVDPSSYALAVFVCGPFMKNHWEAEFFELFAGRPTIGVNLTMTVPLDEWDPFDVLIERDSSRTSNPDITFLSEEPLVPVIGVCLVEEYPPADVPAANAAIRSLLDANHAAIVPIDTRLDTNMTGLRTKAEVASLLARMDVVVTTRLHGTALALKNSVPVVAIDPEPGGGKIKRQAESLGWPHTFSVDELDPWALQEALDACLTPEARRQAAECADRAKRRVTSLRHDFVKAVRALETTSRYHDRAEIRSGATPVPAGRAVTGLSPMHGHDEGSVEVSEIVDWAWNSRSEFDLSGVGYGRIHWGNEEDELREPLDYYYFLAGLVRTLGVSRIVEIGTHQGGSARALAAGLDASGGKIVTFDVTEDGAERLAGHPSIVAYTLDGTSEAAFVACTTEFEAVGAQLAYIDANHDFWSAVTSFQTCVFAIGAEFVVLDDIKLNDDMRRFWDLVCARYGADAVDATDLHPAIRDGGPDPSPGFGVVRIRVG